ncbi:MAG: SDR family NAD(P)-dependent oxidoreductase [Chloroflexota bacterium]
MAADHTPPAGGPLDLTGRVVLVTGAAQGIGEAIARLCAERGALVVLADANAERGEAAAARIRDEGRIASFVQTDVRDAAQVDALVAATVARHGRLDGLVAAAGVLKGPWTPIEELTLEDFDLTQAVNIRGTFLCARAATPHLEASGRGVMVIIASVAGVSQASSSFAYGASKGGVHGLGMTLAGRLADRGIRVNTVCPGNIVTEMKLSVDIAMAQRAGASVDDAVARANREYGSPEGVARLIAFLLSDEADHVRGTIFTR